MKFCTSKNKNPPTILSTKTCSFNTKKDTIFRASLEVVKKVENSCNHFNRFCRPLERRVIHRRFVRSAELSLEQSEIGLPQSDDPRKEVSVAFVKSVGVEKRDQKEKLIKFLVCDQHLDLLHQIDEVVQAVALQTFCVQIRKVYAT